MARRRHSALTATAVGLGVALVGGTLTATPARAAAPGLAITVPPPATLEPASLAAGSLTGTLGTVRVTTGALLVHDASWRATVTATAFTTGGGSAAETIPASAVRYDPGPPTASSGLRAGACLAGLPAELSAPRTAYSCSGLSLLGGTSLSWNPTITVALTPQTVAGTYTGTITHSVA